MPVILLSDNGSTRSHATLQLRHLAQQLSAKTGHAIHPVSLQHANKIPAEELAGIPAVIFRDFMTQQLAQGEREFILLPLFFGNSKALTKFVPDETALLKQQFGDFDLTIAQEIYPLPGGEPMLTEIIYDHIIETAEQYNIALSNIVLVDHGSPIPRVTEVRKHLTQTVQHQLGDKALLEQAVMERREGKEYDFNGDLLEHWLNRKAQANETSVMVILMFFLAGRHAGKGGDIVEICQSVMDQHTNFKIVISPLITEHEKFISILQSRLNAVLK